MYRKISTALLMIFSFLIIAVGGYQCSTRVEQQGTRESIPIDELPLDDYYYEEGYGDSDDGGQGFPEEPQDGCSKDARASYRYLVGQAGWLAKFRFDDSSVEDYRLGARQNFDLSCARMYLNMNKLGSGSSTYKGQLKILFEEDGYVKRQSFSSGSATGENKYNKWTGGSLITGKRFHAIFEGKHTALILKLDDIRELDIEDGRTAYVGAGEIYYKMFRIWTGDWDDVCYTKGVYVRDAPQHTQAKLGRNDRCWLLGRGAFSCRPDGALRPRNQVTDINITGNLRCYSRLGIFFGLNIKEAFNGLP